MGKHPGFHKSDKRKKELARLKKQEEKKQRRLNRGATCVSAEAVLEEALAHGSSSERTEGD